MPCGWEGNRRSGVALAMRHRLQWFIHLRVHDLMKGDEHPTYTPHWVLHLPHLANSYGYATALRHYVRDWLISCPIHFAASLDKLLQLLQCHHRFCLDLRVQSI